MRTCGGPGNTGTPAGTNRSSRPRTAGRYGCRRSAQVEKPPIGQGGFAHVHRALDRQTDQPVAIKIQRDIQDLDGDAAKRFRRELRILNGLSHPNMIRVIAHGDMSDHDEIRYAMPLAQGNLHDRVPEFEGKEIEIVEIMSQICSGLTYVRDAGVLHRDPKPANVLRTSDGQWEISDFGLAREQERMTTTLTWTGDGFGTPLWFQSSGTPRRLWAPAQTSTLSARSSSTCSPGSRPSKRTTSRTARSGR
ncbi:serine/threonine-protein kinase [Streptomyces sp. NPDC050704]|uniref:serine/threonine-protein kinase n=1 Tax=Streptomyces sp. NPDC050704 TaxID=3157219 RepID=UPI003442739B